MPDSFRWVKPAASLKRRWPPAPRPTAYRSFPLGKTGGLIEALAGQPFALSLAMGFRWVKPAASLKHFQPLRDSDAPGFVSAG